VSPYVVWVTKDGKFVEYWKPQASDAK
jgi:hypothetical protein